MPNYDPYTHAHALGVDIIWGTPGQGILGRYDHASRTIILQEGMPGTPYTAPAVNAPAT